MLFASKFRWLNISTRYLTIRKNFDQKTFDYFSNRRLKNSHGNPNLQSIFQTSNLLSYLKTYNSRETIHQFSHSISFEQLNEILFYAYQHQLKLDLLTKRLIECVSPLPQIIQSNLFVEFINLLVLHQQKYYDFQTKVSNKNLETFLRHLEFHLTRNQIKQFSLTEFSLLSSAMYRLQIPLKNVQILEILGEYLIEDEQKKHLSAVDKQNFIKILTLSNYGRIPIAQSLANRFNQSFIPQINPLNYEIVRMTMRIALYFQFFHFYSQEFFENCLRIIRSESKATQLSYRAKDIIQIMNVLIYMGYIHKIDGNYMNLIEMYNREKQFEDKPERLVDVLAPLAMIDCFPEELLNKLFMKENLQRLTESRMKEKLFFISQSSPFRSLVDQKFLQSLPYHIYGSWDIEKRKRKNFSSLVKRLEGCVPNRYYVKTAFILKHFKNPDIIICLNPNQQPSTIPNERKTVFDEDCSLYALQVLSEDEMCINDPLRPLGSFFSKARQLKTLNYIPVIIYPNDDFHQLKTSKEVFSWIVQRAQTTESLLNKI